jgi:phosphohistidine phosphatase
MLKLLCSDALCTSVRSPISSRRTAFRASTTAQLIADTIKLDLGRIIADDELFQASVRTFMEFIRQADKDYNTILCVGHNPAISYLAEYLSKAEIGELPPAGLASIKFELSSWEEVDEGKGEFVQLMTPEKLISD